MTKPSLDKQLEEGEVSICEEIKKQWREDRILFITFILLFLFMHYRW